MLRSTHQSFYDLQITAPVLRAQEAVTERAAKIARLNNQLADVQANIAAQVKALQADLEDLAHATRRQTEALAEEQGRRQRGE